MLKKYLKVSIKSGIGQSYEKIQENCQCRNTDQVFGLKVVVENYIMGKNQGYKSKNLFVMKPYAMDVKWDVMGNK